MKLTWIQALILVLLFKIFVANLIWLSEFVWLNIIPLILLAIWILDWLDGGMVKRLSGYGQPKLWNWLGDIPVFGSIVLYFIYAGILEAVLWLPLFIFWIVYDAGIRLLALTWKLESVLFRFPLEKIATFYYFLPHPLTVFVVIVVNPFIEWLINIRLWPPK